MTVIPYEELQVLSEKYNLSHIIMLVHQRDPYMDHVVTYGQSVTEADQAAEFGNTLKTALGWPESLHQTSTKAQMYIKELEEEVACLKAALVRTD